jgi:hypothetical protein
VVRPNAEAVGGSACGLLEDEAVRRAYKGTLRPQAIGGGKVMMVTEFSDQLLMFLLKCRNPKVFGDRREDTCTSTVSSRLWTSCDRADSDAWHARPLRKRLQRQRQSRWISNLLNWNRLQRKSRKAEAVGGSSEG